MLWFKKTNRDQVIKLKNNFVRNQYNKKEIHIFKKVKQVYD